MSSVSTSFVFSAPEPEKVYKVTTKTGDVDFAGTDEDVFIQIFGEKGSIPSTQLTKGRFGFKTSFKNLFEQGKYVKTLSNEN